MRRSLLLSTVSALILGVAASTTAAPREFTGTLTIRLPFGFNANTPGSGTGTSDGGFPSPATIGSGVFPVHTTVGFTQPFLGVISAVEIAAPGSPGVPGSNGPLNWNGFSGGMPLNASAFLKGFGTTLGAIPLNVVGVGGTQPFQIGSLQGSVVGNLYQLGYFFLTGTLNGSFLTVFASGFDARTANGAGQLQMVAPTFINFSGFGSVPAAAILSLNFVGPPVADFQIFNFQPSRFEEVVFFSSSFDPSGIGIETYLWDFGDGTTFETNDACCPRHLYAADGDYTVQLTVTTFDGRSASTSKIISIETHDVAITKFSVPKSASPGQTRGITVGVNSRLFPEQVQVDLFRSLPGGGFAQVGSLVQSVPVRSGNRTTSFPFSYTFTSEDGAVGKVTFRATATILTHRDALPGDNEAIAPPTKVSAK